MNDRKGLKKDMQQLMFAKKKKKRKRMGHPASILHNKEDHTCYLCILLHQDYRRHGYLETHHIFGGPNRKKSEEYGLEAYLCMAHHREGKEAVHNNHGNMLLLQKEGQQAFRSVYPGKSFLEIFGKNYI